MIVGWFVALAFAGPVTVEEIVSAALHHDPTVVEAESAVVSAEAALRAARGLRHDPSVEARLGFGLAQHEVTVRQPLSLSGEGLSAARASAAALHAAESRRDHRRLEVAAEARQLLIAAIAADAERDRTREVLRLAADLRGAAELGLANGAASELDLNLARLEEAAAAADHVTARREALALREQLAARTAVAPDVELPVDPMTAAPPEVEAGIRADAVAASADVAATDAAVARERAAALPPVDVGLWAQVQNVSATPGADGVAISPWSWSDNAAWTVGPTVSMTLPFWNANRAAVAQAEGDRAVARAKQAALGERIAAETAGSKARRETLALVADGVEPVGEARAALAAIAAAVGSGAMGPAEAAPLRAQVLLAWRRASVARAAAAAMTVDLARIEAWPTLAPATP